MVRSVLELTLYIKELLEGDPELRGVSVKGEVSNFKEHSSGHWYFTLKESGAQVNCVMFRGDNLRFDKPKSGDTLTVDGNITLYPPSGQYQLLVKAFTKQGLGTLYEQFLEIKDRLTKEGIIDPLRRRTLPRFPRCVAVITSPTGAVIEDIRMTIGRRFPGLRIHLYPSKVQGTDAVPALLRQLARANADPTAELILIARGGGSMEDLWCFNDETLARAIADSTLPVLSAVGHETDFTIADFVADVRASTPTAAAEMISPDAEGIRAWLAEKQSQLYHALIRSVQVKRQHIDMLAERLQASMLRQVHDRRAKFLRFEAAWIAMDHSNTLNRGYSMTLKNGFPVTNSTELTAGEEIDTILAKGRIRSSILTTEPS